MPIACCLLPIAQASESSGTGRKSRATVKIPVLGSNPKFALETYSLKIDQVHIPLLGNLLGNTSSYVLSATLFSGGCNNRGELPLLQWICFSFSVWLKISAHINRWQILRFVTWPLSDAGVESCLSIADSGTDLQLKPNNVEGIECFQNLHADRYQQPISFLIEVYSRWFLFTLVLPTGEWRQWPNQIGTLTC